MDYFVCLCVCGECVVLQVASCNGCYVATGSYGVDLTL